MDQQHNPYQAPVAELDVPVAAQPTSGALASRSARLGAAWVDGFAVLAITLPIQWSAGVFDDFKAYTSNYAAMAAWGALGIALSFALNAYWWATRAQSIGKRALGIKIVTLDGQNASFSRIVFRRLLPVQVVSMIPVLGGLFSTADALAIFRGDQRCLHDLIAETRVVRA